METILVHPENSAQFKAVKAVLEALKVPYERQSERLPDHVLKSAEKSISQYENGQTISLSEFTGKHFMKK